MSAIEKEFIMTPAQQLAADSLKNGITAGDILVLRSGSGMGRTTILEHVHAAIGGGFVGVRQFMEILRERNSDAIEEAFLEMIELSLVHHDTVIVDDLHLITNITEACNYARRYLLDAALTALLGEAGARRKKLVFGVDTDDAPWPVQRRASSFEIGEFTATDYECICRAYLGNDIADRLDYARIHRFAPMLNAYQLKNACAWLMRETTIDTTSFVEYLRSRNMATNVEIQEVAPVTWDDLKGLGDLVRALEAKIALPFENDVLAAEYHLKPKRGVLLAGPPGTGKTTIGRALAHRLKSKFFLIDGTVIAGSGDFYGKVEEVFEAAKMNAPSVIFIDDADVILQGDKEPGFYRYLLTMLDGLESASAERVCVIMTVMDVSSLPQAILRSGRVELWLETRLPDAEARAAIVREKLLLLPPPIGGADVAIVASASRGLTGADLKSVVEDGKLLFAHDKANEKPLREPEAYFLEAIESVRSNRRNYARSKPARFGDIVKIGFNAE